ncbi:MAG: MFS transporter [Anaerolineae bacterium]|nr:MFS transporter [Anaerolineae bacterium]
MDTIVFRRDRLTWLLYALLSYYAYMQALISPALNFLGDEIDLSFSVRGLHVTAFAAGMVSAGLLGERATARWGRRRVLWIGGVGMAIGSFVLIAGRTALVTLGATLIMGLIGSFMLVVVQSALADHHGEKRAVALTESNVAAVFFAALAPFAAGAGESLGLGWRAGMVAGVIVFAGLYLFGRALPFPVAQDATPDAQAPRTTRLPRTFWLIWLAAFFGVGTEWSTIFWSGEFLERSVNITAADASALLGLFLIMMMIGRFAGSRLSERAEPIRLIVLSQALAIFGLTIFWLGPVRELTLSGYLLAGLGIANLYPLALVIGVNTAPRHSDLASARMSLASGSAILIAPIVLGSLADVIGIQTAIGVTALLALLALAAALGSWALRNR